MTVSYVDNKSRASATVDLVHTTMIATQDDLAHGERLQRKTEQRAVAGEQAVETPTEACTTDNPQHQSRNIAAPTRRSTKRIANLGRGQHPLALSKEAAENKSNKLAHQE